MKLSLIALLASLVLPSSATLAADCIPFHETSNLAMTDISFAFDRSCNDNDTPHDVFSFRGTDIQSPMVSELDVPATTVEAWHNCFDRALGSLTEIQQAKLKVAEVVLRNGKMSADGVKRDTIGIINCK